MVTFGPFVHSFYVSRYTYYRELPYEFPWLLSFLRTDLRMVTFGPLVHSFYVSRYTRYKGLPYEFHWLLSFLRQCSRSSRQIGGCEKDQLNFSRGNNTRRKLVDAAAEHVSYTNNRPI